MQKKEEREKTLRTIGRPAVDADRRSHVGQTIRKYRAAAGMDQADVAAVLGCTKTAVGNWELGLTRPDIDNLPKLCSLLHIPVTELLGIEDPYAKGHPAIDYFNPIDFCNAYAQKKNIELKKELVTSTGKYVDLSINYLANQNLIFGIMKDVTDTVDYEKRIMKVKMETLTTTDDVIKKQMRVAQEIASR